MKDILIGAMLVVGSFFGGYTIATNLNHPNVDIEKNKEIAYELVNKYFDNVTYTGYETGEKSYFSFSAGNYSITTDILGEKILLVSQSPECSSSFNLNNAVKLTENELVDIAVNQIEKYIDIKYDIFTNILNIDDDSIIDIEVFEKRDGLETGANGFVALRKDGTVVSLSFNERVLDNPGAEIVIGEDQALKTAISDCLSTRTDLVEVNPAEKSVELRTGQSGQIYNVYIIGKTESYNVECEYVINALSGEIVNVTYTDR